MSGLAPTICARIDLEGDVVDRPHSMPVEHLRASCAWHAPCSAVGGVTRKHRQLPPRDASGRFIKVRPATARGLYTAEDVARACAAAVDRDRATRRDRRWKAATFVGIGLLPTAALAWMVLA